MAEYTGKPADSPIVPVENCGTLIAVPAGSPVVPFVLLNVDGKHGDDGNAAHAAPLAGVRSDTVCAAVRSKFKNTIVWLAGTVTICDGAGVDVGDDVGCAASAPMPETRP